jgi:hypothetical protein
MIQSRTPTKRSYNGARSAFLLARAVLVHADSWNPCREDLRQQVVASTQSIFLQKAAVDGNSGFCTFCDCDSDE